MYYAGFFLHWLIVKKWTSEVGVDFLIKLGRFLIQNTSMAELTKERMNGSSYKGLFIHSSRRLILNSS